MPNSPAHLTEWTLEQLAEGTLAHSEEATAREHLQRCAHCRAEVESYRSLFAALSDLPRFAPSDSFADGVMARVRMAPETDPLYARLVKWMPRTRRGWTLLATSVAAPALPVIALLLWILTQPMVTVGGLWQMATGKVAEGAMIASGQLAQWSASLGLSDGVVALYQALSGVPISTLGLIAAVLAVATPLSAWLLVRLLRAPMGRVTYANG